MVWKSETYYDFLKNIWNSAILGGTSWNQALHDGFYNESVRKQRKNYRCSTAAQALKSANKTGAF